MASTGNITHIRSARDTLQNPSGLTQLCFLQASSAQIREMIRDDTRAISEMKQELSLLENASLYIKQHKGRFSFSCRPAGSKQQIGITSDTKRINRLARREFLKQRIRSAERRLRELQRVNDRAKEAQQMQVFQAKLQRYADAGIDLASVFFTREQNAWIDQPFSPNPYHPENLKYPTRGGVLMRSKSEVTLGSRLEELGLPYRYDDLVTIHFDPMGDRPFRDTYFADFKLPNLCSGITVHEHLGAFQIERYAENALQRLHDYHRYDLIELPGRPVRRGEFTWSFEGDLYDQGLLDKLIRRMLLPGV